MGTDAVRCAAMLLGRDTSRVMARWIGASMVASAVVVDPAGAAPFGPAKWWAISTLGFAAAGYALWQGTAPFHRRAAIAWAVMLGAVVLGAAVNHDVPTALLGHPTRHLGVITWVLFALLFAAGQQLTTVDARIAIARAGTVGLVAIGLWALWELAVGPPVELTTTTDRLTGPYGSAAYLGAAVCLFGPLTIDRAADATAHRLERLAAAVVTVLGTVALIGSGARAAWLAATVTAALVLVRRRPTRRVWSAAGGVLVVAIAVVAPRLADVTERTVGASSRVDEWRVAVRVLGHHPLTGVGPEGYRIAVAEGVDRDYERSYGRSRVLPDRAHSGPLDVALAGGVPAAAAQAALLAFLARRAWRALVAAPAVAALAASVLAYGLQQLLLFPLAELDPVWWALAGALVAVPVTTATAAPRRARTMVAAASVAVAAVAGVAGVLDVAADRLAGLALRSDDPATAIDEAERGVRLRPDDVNRRMLAAVVHRRRGTLDDLDAAATHADAALRWSPDDPVAGDQRASIALERAVATGRVDDVAAAVDAWARLVARDPVRARWQLQYGRAAALAGDSETARRAWATAADLDPRDTTAATLLDGLED